MRAKVRREWQEPDGQDDAWRRPLLEKRKTFVGITLEAAIEKFLNLKLDEFINEKHCKQWRSTLGTYAKPVLDRKQVSEICVQNVLRV